MSILRLIEKAGSSISWAESWLRGPVTGHCSLLGQLQLPLSDYQVLPNAIVLAPTLNCYNPLSVLLHATNVRFSKYKCAQVTIALPDSLLFSSMIYFKLLLLYQNVVQRHGPQARLFPCAHFISSCCMASCLSYLHFRPHCCFHQISFPTSVPRRQCCSRVFAFAFPPHPGCAFLPAFLDCPPFSYRSYRP